MRTRDQRGSLSGSLAHLDWFEAVEAAPFLISVQRTTGASDVGATSWHHQRAGCRLELDGQQLPGQVERPRRLDEAPPRIRLGSQAHSVTFDHQGLELIGEPDPGSGIAFIDEEPLRQFLLVDDMEGVNHVVEAELNCPGAERVLVQFATVVSPARIEEPTLLKGALLVVRSEMGSDPSREWQRKIVETDRLRAIANLEQRLCERELVRRDVLTEQHDRPPVGRE
jgi:hypothetical protein